MANNVYFFNITYKTWDKNVPVWLSKLFYQIVVAVQSLSCVRFFVIPWTAPCQAFLSSIISQSLIKFMSIELVILSNHLILCCAHFPCHPQSFPASGSFPVSHLFTSDDQSIGASALASNEYSELISFRIDWLDFLALQGTVKSLLQQHSSKASIL